MSESQTGFTAGTVARREMYDQGKRKLKALKILSVLENCCGNLSGLSLLDLSCSTGIMTRVFAEHFARVTGIDIDLEAVAYAAENQFASNLDYQAMDALDTSFGAGEFDVIICNQMYEHVSDPHQLMAETYRLLKPGGVCYFGATNRLKLIETHYGRIPLLSIMPKTLASWLLRTLGKAEFYAETHLTLWELERLVERFEVIDYTRYVIEDPVRFHATDLVRQGSRMQKVALAVLSWAYWLFPGYIWVLRKPPEDD